MRADDPHFFTRADLEADPVTPNTQLGTYTNFVNLMDLCAASRCRRGRATTGGRAA